MIEIQGICNTARCYCETLEPEAAEQIQRLCNLEAFRESTIRIMPDVHAGKGCTIGTTVTIQDRVIPNMVGVDIGCGMETVRLRQKQLHFQKLDEVIRQKIPSGMKIRRLPLACQAEVPLEQLYCANHVNIQRARQSIGTLGGGNHFIEVDQDSTGALYLVVHSGSRHLGVQVAKYYQNEGQKAFYRKASGLTSELIADMKAQGRQREIQAVLDERRAISEFPPELIWVEEGNFYKYLHDMEITQQFADLNRKAMVQIILEELGLEVEESFTTVHNYIDLEKMILRKGAVSAEKDQKLLIPINMRDGSLICLGKGNPDWNFSAPHGAGRLMSRTKARASLTMEEFRKQMQGIYTTCVRKETLDESPMAYKSMEEITSQIEPAVQILERVRPVYNFKASN